MAEPALGQILDHIRAEPSRTWSIIITVYGDALVPRGGCVWLGTLLALFKAMDVSEGVVRTAMSRLAADGWLERKRVGRNSFYRLAEKGRGTFAEAAQHIYGQHKTPWKGHFDLVLLGPNGGDGPRSALAKAGYGSPSSGIWLAPAGQPLLQSTPDALTLKVSGEPTKLQELAARSWPLGATAEAYQRFIGAFEPMRAALAAGAHLGDLEALVGRILLIHEFRRIVLRDPRLPAAVLPGTWPGDRARSLCADVYKFLVGPSERWLDANAIDASGAPLPGSPEILRRFRTP